jgi:hypothetical protein
MGTELAAARSRQAFGFLGGPQKRIPALSLIILIIILVLIFGGGGGYYAHRSYGLPGLGGVLGFLLLILILAWFFGGLGSLRV